MKDIFKKRINKKTIYNILLFMFIFISVFSIIIVKPLGDLDELWNYNTARAITIGKIPYKDISMITTPLLPMITSIFLKLISNELIISRILSALLCTGILFSIFKILVLCIKEENAALICTALIGILCKDIYCIDYNLGVLLIALLIVYKEIKNKPIYSNNKAIIYNRKQDFLIRNISRSSNLYQTEHRDYFSVYSYNSKNKIYKRKKTN